MASSKMTLIGLYNYDDTLFDNLTIPASLDKSVLINNILMRGGEFEVLYSNLDFMKYMLTSFSTKWNRTFNKWVDALAITYDPLNNYDRTETFTDSHVESGSSTNIGNVSDAGSYTDTAQSTAQNGGTNEHSVSADDSSTYEPRDKDTTSSSMSGSNSSTSNTTNSTTSSNAGTTQRTLGITHTANIKGNIGVTTSQQMLQAELDISMWNVYDHITDVFLQEFIIPVY